MAAGVHDFAHDVAPGAPPAGKTRTYSTGDGKFEWRESGGTTHEAQSKNERSQPDGYSSLDSNGQVPIAELPTLAGLKHDLAASGAPGASNDSTGGWGVGSLWMSSSGVYRCRDASPGAAVWERMLGASELEQANGVPGLDSSKYINTARISQLSVTQHQAALSIGPNQVGATVVEETTTARALTDADHGKTIYCTNVAGCTISVPNGLRSDFVCAIVQFATVQVTVQASGTGIVRRAATFAATIKTKEQYAACDVRHTSTANTYLVTGLLEAA